MLRALCCLSALAALTGCAGQAAAPAPTTASTTSTAAARPTTSAAAPPPQPRTARWVDLAVGDCLAEPPPTDPAVVLVTVVDCSAPHQAETFLRASIPVDAAVTRVNKQGQHETKMAFYVRTGNGTHEFTDPDEKAKYVAQRWPQRR